jgi:hypothetical protein
MGRLSKWELLLVGCGALAAVVLFVMVSCGDTTPPTTPSTSTPSVESGSVSAGEEQETGSTGGSDSWTKHGVTVTVLADDWGPGSCHTNGGSRTLRIENNSELTRYSRRAAYTDPGLVCATQHTQTGKPNMTGPAQVAPGQTIEVTYTVQPPECGSVQADDCWGPGGISECVFVIGDVFKSSKICDGCVEDPVETSSTECGEWNECHEHPEAGCFQEKECVETTTMDYKCKPDVTTTREFEEVQPCDCDCETEWSDWEETGTECGEWSLCKEPTTFSASSGDKKCERTRNCVTTFERVEKCTQEKQERVERDLESEKCTCEDPSLCHISNQGGDHNKMMVITPAPGHPQHVGRCPGDLPLAQCNCPDVFARAAQCHPQGVNWDCTDNR